MLWFQALLRPCPSQKSCGHIGFPTTTKVNFLASPQQRTPWPVFQDGRCNTSPTSPYYNVTIDSFSKLHSLHAISGYHYLVSGSFHPPKGFFSAFPHGTKFAIGLKKYLELGVDASQIQTRFPTDPTQEHHIKTFPSHIYGAITLYGATFQKKLQLKQKGPSRSKTPHLLQFTKQDSVCPKSFSLAVTHDIEIFLSSPPLTKMFQFSGFPILHESNTQKKDV